MRHVIRVVAATESVVKEIVEINLLLPHESAGGQFPVNVQIEHGTDRSGRRDLDGAAALAEKLAVVNLARIRDLRQVIVLPTRHRAEDQHDILWRDGHGIFENVLENLPAVIQTKLVHQETHQIAMAAITNGFVVERADFAVERFAERADSAGRVEGFVVDSVEAEML